MAIDPLSAGIELAGTVINKIWPDKTEQEKQELAAALVLVQGQMKINEEEAKSSSFFVAGWRPFIGWVCGAGCAWNWVGLPVFTFVASTFLHIAVNVKPADLTEMLPLLMGLLGLGGLRTYEKTRKVA